MVNQTKTISVVICCILAPGHIILFKDAPITSVTSKKVSANIN